MMAALDVILRVAAATLWLALAAGLAGTAWRARGVRWCVALALALCGFLAGNTPDPALQLAGAGGRVAGLLSGSVAPLLWWFCRSLYDDDFRIGPRHALVAAVWWPVMLLDRGVVDVRFAGQGLSWLLVALALAMCLDLVVRVWRDRSGDLVDARRRGRGWVVAALLGLLLADLLADLAMGLAWRPRAFAMAQNAALLGVAVMVARRVLRVDAGALAYAAPGAGTGEPVAPGDDEVGQGVDAGRPRPTPADTDAAATRMALRQRLERLVTVERIHRDPALTIAAFAARMGAPEADVRRLVNRDLGWRHFRSFLNHYRLADAKLALADPARARDKILAIAFDAGFASLASFNRCFSQAEGMSPGEYRTRALAGRADP